MICQIQYFVVVVVNIWNRSMKHSIIVAANDWECRTKGSNHAWTLFCWCRPPPHTRRYEIRIQSQINTNSLRGTRQPTFTDMLNIQCTLITAWQSSKYQIWFLQCFFSLSFQLKAKENRKKVLTCILDFLFSIRNRPMPPLTNLYIRM